MKKTFNQPQLEIGTYEQILSHLERELQLNGLEAPDDLQINTASQQATQQNSGKLKPTCHHCRKPGHYWNQSRQLKREKAQREIRRAVPTIATKIMLMVKQTLTPTKKFPTIPTQTIQIIKKTENLDLSANSVRPVVKLTTPQKIVTLEPMQRKDRLPGIDDRKDKSKSNREVLKATQMGMFKLQPKL